MEEQVWTGQCPTTPQKGQLQHQRQLRHLKAPQVSPYLIEECNKEIKQKAEAADHLLWQEHHLTSCALLLLRPSTPPLALQWQCNSLWVVNGHN